MRKSFALLLIGLFAFSCNTVEYGKNERDKFIAEYRQSFLNSDLSLFNYNTRVKFYYQVDTITCRFFIRQDDKLIISQWPGNAKPDTTDKFLKLTADYIKFLETNRDTIGKTGIRLNGWIIRDSADNLALSGDSARLFPIPESTFAFDPISYFKHLDSLVNLYGILEIQKKPEYTRLAFHMDKSLIYFPDTLPADTSGMILKRIDDRWYISNEKLNLDY